MSKPDSGTIKRRNKHGPIGCAQKRMPEDSVLANRLRLIVHRGSSPAAAQFKAWVVAKLPDTPEGLGIDSHGNLYATLLIMHIGEIVMLKDDGSYDHIAWVPSKEESGKGDLIGLDLDQSGNIYVAYTGHSKHDFRKDLANPFHPACRDATVTQSGVYKIDAKTRKVTPLATKVEGWAFFAIRMMLRSTRAATCT